MERRFADVWGVVLVLLGLCWFSSSFFLAKRSLSQVSKCNEAAFLLQEQLHLSNSDIFLLQNEGILSGKEEKRQGCWMPRHVESIVILLVDALRFDFAYYNLPLSVGKRLNAMNHSRLFQFIADPPTVTMQRLKGLTTGGLPTFADLSANFGGATVEDDSWVKQLRDSSWKSRGLQYSSKSGFVGDDTWEDLFPHYFTESHPYPSFNTRDIETVDNGCLKQLPHMLERIRMNGKSESELELIVVHFLGVDHVGHTYGPHNEHMDAKLKDMDAALQTVLEILDGSDKCHSALIFGDHGMTEDGNHGGGTIEETNAALFVHTSPSCTSLSKTSNLETQTKSELVAQTFSSIHQIDLVPTISTLLGLPIPYANLGGLVPSLVPGQDVRHTATGLALNAAQVWRYLTVYSETANRLPDLPVLREKLELAVSEYREALSGAKIIDTDKYLQASMLFKSFLTDAFDLGQRVWTRFNYSGMVGGICVLVTGFVLFVLPIALKSCSRRSNLSNLQYWEILLTAVFMVFTTGILTFSNSYILEEQSTIMYSLSVLSIVIALRILVDPVQSTLWRGVVLLPLASRLNEIVISGHGADPSIRLHWAHSPLVFLTSVVLLCSFRWNLYKRQVAKSLIHAVTDVFTLLLLAGSWCEKRSLDPSRNGYALSSVALILLFSGLLLVVVHATTEQQPSVHARPSSFATSVDVQKSHTITIVSKVLIAVVAVSGPAAAPSLACYAFQVVVIYRLGETVATLKVQSFIVAALLRLATRHVFFATNHGCFFNRLQYSAAFVATEEFSFVLGGISLFLNTFGWEMAGLGIAWLIGQQRSRSDLWKLYTAYQVVEAIASCFSVSVLRRHLMVWDIYAPHFVFTATFTVLHVFTQLTTICLSYV